VSTTKTVARNSFWYGLEVAFGALVVLGTSFVVARSFGPHRLAYFTFLLYLTFVAGTLGSVGLPIAIQKYMAEYLGKEQPGISRSIFWWGFKRQAALVSGILAIALPLAWFLPPPDHRWVAIWLVLGMAPRMLGFLVGQINAVTNNLSRNLAPTLVGNVVSVAINLATVWFDWGVLGLAVAHPVSNTIELGLKFFSTRSTRRQWKQAGPAPIAPELHLRMRTFAFQGLGMVVLNILVWDRSDVFLLKTLSPDISQVTFFSYSYSLIERLLTIPQVLGGAMGLSLMTEFGKDSKRVATLAASSATYLLLLSLPVMLGALAINRPLWMIYGPKFAPAVPVFTVMAVLGVSRIIMAPANYLLQATERQGFLLGLTCVAGLIHLGLNALLIPTHGAVGAAFGNGIGQAVAVLGAWAYIVRQFQPRVDWTVLGRIVLSAVMMVATVMPLSQHLPPLSGALISVAVGAGVYLGMLRLTRALRDEDRDRFLSLVKVFPAALRYPINRVLWTIIPQAR